MLFEVITLLSRPISLMLRLSINLIIGHIAGFAVYYLFGNFSRILFLLIESIIILLQVRVFTLLIILYMDE